MYQKQVSFVEAIKMGFNKYCCFQGRASRSEFWFWTLFILVVQAVLAAFGNSTAVQAVSALFGLAIFLPGLGVAVRRLHDVGRAGGWIFINCIPLVGTIIYIVWVCQPSQVGDNRFGQMPNLVAA